MCKNVKIKIKINNNIYEADVIILPHTAQDLLLSTNWLGLHKAILNIDLRILTLTNNKGQDIIPITCAKLQNIPIKYFPNEVTHIACHAKNKTILEPHTTKLIEITMKTKGYHESKNNSVFLIQSDSNSKYEAAIGVFDKKNANQLLVLNSSHTPKEIEKGEKIAYTIPINNAKIQVPNYSH